MSRVSSSIREKGTDTQAVRSKRRRQLTLVGVTLLAVGLCCLGWVAYQYVGTNLIAQREFRAETSRLRAQWAEAQRTDPQRLQQTSTGPGEAIGLLRIPALGEAYEVPTDTWVIDPVPGKPELNPTSALITLTTCPDLFHSSKRSVGFGHLVRTERK